MKNALDKRAQVFSGTGSTRSAAKTSGYDRHPYLKSAFWQNPLNQFWNTDMYSSKSKEYFNNWITTI
jgi:hypothetical protein